MSKVIKTTSIPLDKDVLEAIGFHYVPNTYDGQESYRYKDRGLFRWAWVHKVEVSKGKFEWWQNSDRSYNTNCANKVSCLEGVIGLLIESAKIEGQKQMAGFVRAVLEVNGA